jgi:hypothetical protein
MKNIFKIKTLYNYRLVIFFFFLIISGCSNVDYQRIIINNEKKAISILDSNFVIDSISIGKFGKSKLSISLKDKMQGISFLDIIHPNPAYKVYVDEFSALNCDDENLTLSIIIRKKGESIKVTEDLANNFKTNPNIQVLYRKYFPCSKEIDTIETDGHFK